MFSSFLKEAFPIIEKAAPTISTVLGGPVAGITTTYAINLLARKFGINNSDIQDLSKAIINDPNANDKLAEIDKIVSNMVINNSLSSAEINVKLTWNQKDS